MDKKKIRNQLMVANLLFILNVLLLIFYFATSIFLLHCFCFFTSLLLNFYFATCRFLLHYFSFRTVLQKFLFWLTNVSFLR